MATSLVLAENERLTGIRKERYTKPRDGRDVAYLVCDRLGQVGFLAQKLRPLVQVINQHVETEAWARVSVNGLWESIDRTDGKVGPWVKGRWKVRSVDLERAVDGFEQERAVHNRAVIVADSTSCYAITA